MTKRLHYFIQISIYTRIPAFTAICKDLPSSFILKLSAHPEYGRIHLTTVYSNHVNVRIPDIGHCKDCISK